MQIEAAARSASSLREVWVISVPDCLLVGSWSRVPAGHDDEAAVELGSLYQSCQSALHWGSSIGPARWVTIEAEDVVLILARTGPELVTVLCFDRRVPMGLVRMQARQVLEHVAADTGEEPDPLRHEVGALLKAIRERAPEPRAALAHLARQAGVSVDRLERLETLARDQLRAVLSSGGGRT